MQERTMQEILQDLGTVENNLKEQGITPEKAELLFQALSDYVTIKDDVIKARSSQFALDAERILYQIKAYTGRNGDLVSRFLREFAENVVRQTTTGDVNVKNIVDRIQPIFKDEMESTENEQ